MRAYLESLPSTLPEPPKAILAVSAHWEEAVPTVTTAARPPLLFDYYGCPPEAYTLTWPAPGDPALAARVRGLLAEAGIASAEAPDRGYDHGTFVPLKVAWPGAEVPTVQLSLVEGLDPAAHLALGRALAPLRDEGVLVLGSGMSFHDMRAFGRPQALEASLAFDGWLGSVAGLGADERDAQLCAWTRAPAARACHPREEHLLPLMVVAGAAGADRGAVPYRDRVMGAVVSAVHFG
jgi:aromatic ring-opening dioxygenase catalytic subunit (LigB family)